MLRIGYVEDTQEAKLTWGGEPQSQVWLQVKRISLDHEPHSSTRGECTLYMPWWSFLTFRGVLGGILKGSNTSYSFEENASILLQQAKSRANIYAKAIVEGTDTSNKVISEKLAKEGFIREMTQEQSRNVCKLASLPSGASFSVPGAGKTTEAIAWFLYRREPKDALLVVCPKNAFASWEEQWVLCTGKEDDRFFRLQGGVANIAKILKQKPPLMLISYQQMCRVSNIVAHFLSTNRTFMILDESHRIKRGIPGQTAEAVLGLSHLPVGKMILSGTPMPQSTADLDPQFVFLYPEVDIRTRDVVELFRPIYVRTTKSELGIPDPIIIRMPIPMLPTQYLLYQVMRSEVARQGSELRRSDISAFRSMGKSVMNLLEMASNPALLADRLIGLEKRDMLSAVLAEGDSPKVRTACLLARQNAQRNKKTIIWSGFVKNVEMISNRLADLGADYIHGGVGTGDEDDNGTRENKIKRFHDDPNAMILVANPAAAGESISLHKVCQNAVYVDRSFNVAHFIQSMDRIHRLGLKPGQNPRVVILESVGTIDEVTAVRLSDKIGRMGRVLEDPSLLVEPIPVDIFTEELDENLGITSDDIEAILAHLSGASL